MDSERVFARFDGVVAAVSTRTGGVSKAPYDSANMALHVGDDPDAVLENRRRFCSAVGIDPGNLVCAEQVHGNRVARVAAGDRGKGATSVAGALPGVDGLLTDRPGVPLAVFTADCVPIFLYAPGSGIAGLAHAGWRGTLSRIAEILLGAVQEQFGVGPQSCLVALGPSAGPCCYEVGDDVVAGFRESGHPIEGIVSRGEHDKARLDLWEANARQLEGCGVPRGNISWPTACTVCSTAYFSCRRDGAITGRNMSVIALR